MLRFWRRQETAAAAEDEAPERLGDVLAEMRRIQVDSRRLITDVLAGGCRSIFRGAGVEFADVREYVEGDDPRSVDWNVTARIGRPFVKRFVEERERTMVFVLDLSASMVASFGAWSLRQLAARFCALMGLAAVANHDRVGLIAGADRVRRFVPPQAGAAHVFEVLRDCVAMPLSTRGSNLSALLTHAGGRLRRRAVVFVLSDFVAALPERELTVAARRHDLVAVRLSPREFQVPPPVLLRVCDPVTGGRQQLDFQSASVRDAFVARVRQQRRTVDEQLAARRVDCIDLCVPAEPDAKALAGPLLRFIRRREMREVRR